MSTFSIAIIGGGTAGWLVLNHIAHSVWSDKVSLTLIESPDIPSVGVGEGTVPSIRKSLQSFGISETDLIRRCDATFKQSIQFVNWLDANRHGRLNQYHHLFDAPNATWEPLIQHYLAEPELDFAHLVSAQASLCDELKGPKNITMAEYQGASSYAYHLNAAKFAQLLADNVKSKFKIEHVRANVVDASLFANGYIRSLHLDQGIGEQAFDFYVDCSGFESVLISKTLNVPLVDVSDTLLVNKAIVTQVPTSLDSEIPPYTKATAHQAGWIWDIALTERRGVGFVYSDNHLDNEQAAQKLDRYLQGKLADLPHRTIDMKVGFRQQFWKNNCVAMGLAQGFLEPIEATSILLTDMAGEYLAQRLPTATNALPMLQKRFNDTMSYAWERVVEFAKLHYLLSDREDSAFWKDNRAAHSIPDELASRLALWQQYPPSTQDFFSRYEVFNAENYLYVMYGMKFKSKPGSLSIEQRRHLVNIQEQLETYRQQLVKAMPSHRELINKIHQYGLQKQ
ncbi:tryptophan halogenase family protein [Paraferrimonas haliotis]|uniref:Tryptophan halogenase n=1 Tax=Paraferrimonas haliotis TaxID=2013866 RepID=A0AA37TSB6_9GAMM|nr:tryptophan halogenase family protein [Paraferrimonas haliotis]GLS84863.1 tryptophan halogenase [Paraferrimonas haliotis]